jgi:hypothetical protein
MSIRFGPQYSTEDAHGEHPFSKADSKRPSPGSVVRIGTGRQGSVTWGDNEDVISTDMRRPNMFTTRGSRSARNKELVSYQIISEPLLEERLAPPSSPAPSSLRLLPMPPAAESALAVREPTPEAEDEDASSLLGTVTDLTVRTALAGGRLALRAAAAGGSSLLQGLGQGVRAATHALFGNNETSLRAAEAELTTREGEVAHPLPLQAESETRAILEQATAHVKSALRQIEDLQQRNGELEAQLLAGDSLTTTLQDCNAALEELRKSLEGRPELIEQVKVVSFRMGRVYEAERIASSGGQVALRGAVGAEEALAQQLVREATAEEARVREIITEAKALSAHTENPTSNITDFLAVSI